MSQDIKAGWVGDVFREFVDGVLRREFPRSGGYARTWYANGQLASEVAVKGGGWDGVYKEWHENGRLKKETTYVNRQIHGVVRQWNSEGILLGEYSLEHGKGTAKKWTEDGRLIEEIEHFGPGRAKVVEIDEDTGKKREGFLWNGKPVGRKKFCDELLKQQKADAEVSED